ncbi:hypothetical protein [Nannocystis radixulma]|uniref:Uncharacterized protein n=1 Tax=Nannocystis radixulma TaxID=2995305 RepID=A0ABT5BCN2_9BACT|nr:hypothetical protein [Nannocystis radixulma]MDC0671899.1 hypothetical protein [Nannocystis radixulma]
MPARLRLVPPFLSLVMVAALGCGLHLHRPRDAASAEGADGELKAARLVDGFAEELGQSQTMLTDEVAAAQAWAEVGRNRDLLDILGAKGETDPEIAVLYFTRCRARFKGDGWTTLCSKISTRLHALTGHAFPLSDPPAPVSGSKAKAPVAAGPDPAADLLRELRTLQRHWKGPDSAESRLARAANEHQLAARALRLGSAEAAGPGCPVLDHPGRAPVLQASSDRQRRLCDERRANLQALRERAVCNGPACGPSELGALVGQLLDVHDALQQHNDELARRLHAYEAAKQSCAAPEPQTGKLKPIPPPPLRRPPASPEPATPAPATSGPPGLSSEPGKPVQPAPDRPASVATASVPGTMSSGTGLSAHVSPAMPSSAAPGEHARLNLPRLTGPIGQVALFPGAGLLGQPWAALAPTAGPDPAAPTPATRAPNTTTSGSASLPQGVAPTAGSTSPTPGTVTTATSGTVAPSTPTTAPTSPGTLVVAPGTCDDAVLQARFAELAEVPIPPLLVTQDLRPLAELGRRQQLAEQLAAVDALIEARQLRARRKAAADNDPKAAEALASAPRFARIVHTTIVGIDRLEQTVSTLELAVMALIRETLRVEHDALVEAIALAERRLRLARAKLAAQLDEAVFLMEAHAGLAKLERAGCTLQALMPAYEAGKCRDELTKSLVAYGNAWTLGRANEKRADVLDLGVRHDASILRSRAAMALRQVYLAAGVTELVKFTKGGMAPEALAQIIVSTVGFGVLAGAVLAQ